MASEEFNLKIKTSDRFKNAGTIATVCVKIIGRDNSSDWTVLDYIFKNDFTRGSTETYTVTNKEEPIGPPILLHFRLKGLKVDVWMCDDVTVQHSDCDYYFPVYDWLEDDMVVMRGEATLPQKVADSQIFNARAAEIFSNRCKFQWQEKASSQEELGWELPRFIDSKEQLPLLLQETVAKRKQNRLNSWKTKLNATRNKLRGLFSKMHSPADFKELYKHIEFSDPPFILTWRKDSEMGRQMLTGMSPLDIERCQAMPKYCLVTNDEVGCLLPEGCTLESEMKAGRVYIADYTLAKSVKRNKDPQTKCMFVHADCIGLFYANSEGQFLPIAIQLVPDDEDYIFTPNDSEYDWLLAKMYLRCSSQSFQQWKYRFLHTNAVSETFAVATFRNLPRCHPVYKLLRPHLRSVAQVNQDEREEAIADDSDINECVSLNTLSLIRHFYYTFNIDDLDIPAVLKKNGLCDRDLLPNFHYRDDALDLWTAINIYVEDIMRIFYECDEDVKLDYELQEWARDFATEGFGWQDGNTRGAPERIDSVQQLIRVCTIIVFTSSVQHAVVTYGQMETYQFVPNAPCAMRLPVHEKGKATLECIMDSLPDMRAANTMISFSYGLSTLAKNEVCLVDLPTCFFGDDEAVDVQLRFRENLKELSRKFHERNQSLEIPYTLSLPENIPISVVN